MDEAYLSWLGLIPGVARRRAMALGERFPSVEALRTASVEDIASVEGIGPALARRIKAFAGASREEADFSRSNEAFLYLCPACGALIAKHATVCPICRAELEGEEMPEPAPALEAEVLQAPRQALNLCPSCGAFVGEGAATCPLCGATLEGEDAAEPAAAEEAAPLPPEAISSEPSRYLCTMCGAFLHPQDRKCPACGVEFEEGEIAAETLAAGDEEAVFFPICPSCGALVPSAAKKCVICDHKMGAPIPAKPEPTEELGITKDFLERWRRVAEERAESPEQKLLRELEHFEQILSTDSTLERAWLKKAGILLQLGRVRDAIACYEALADLNPAKEERYRLEVLDIAQTQADMSLLPRRWSQVPATEAPPELVSAPRETMDAVRGDPAKIVEALTFYDRLLATDPSLLVAWQTKAELLGRLGREDEARAALGRVEALRAAQREGALGLRTIAPHYGPRAEGRVNGLAGRTNGRVNGSGRINGTGRVNGRVNGLTPPAGRTNGMTSGVAPGEGMVNGLVNGNGFTNGRRGRWAGEPPGGRPSWVRSVGMIAAVVLLLLMTPILATLISTSPPPGGIAIDGDFRDWTGIPEYADDGADQLANPDVNLVGYRVRVADGTMLLYARVSGSFFRAVAGGADVLYAFVDEDGDPATGFRVGSIGAERAVELYGWNGSLMGSAGWVYNADRTGSSSDDWLSFDRAEGGRAASVRNEVEARVDLGPAFLEDRARILVYALDFARNGDPADGAVGTALGAITVTQRALVGDVVAGPSVPFLHLAVRALATPVQVVSLSLERFGSYPGPMSGDLYLDGDGDGAVDPEDILLGTAAFAPDATFSLDREVSVPESYVFVANLPAAAPDASVGFRVATVAVAGGPEVAVTLRDASPVMAYVDSAPATITVDGAFGDWSRFALRLDGDDDVQTLGGTASVNENIDLRAYEAVASANVSFYLRVDGRILGGVDIPNTRDRYHPATIVDTDGDTVPDEIEALINPALVSDFNNDYVSDLDQFDDVDQDGLLDYNKCTSDDCSAYTDYVLETRIPIWYPAPYAGRDVARYIGPISLPPQRGVDTAYVYVDRDNRTDTGLLVYVDGIPYGMDFAYEAVGRGGVILDAGLYAYNASRAIPWERFADAPTAVDAHQLEASFDASLFNLTANHTFVFFTKDWRFDFDHGRSGPQRAPGAWTRSIAGDNVVINEVSPKPNPEWVEFANPTDSPISVEGWTLQRRKGKNWVTVVTLSGTIGAWGSGTEYLSVTLPDNSLPNGGNLVRLVTGGGVEVDRTRYDNVGNRQSWSRFKDALTGKPVDTDADGNDFYVSLLPSPGRGNDRHRPRITVAKIADRTTAVPGETITYTVYYNNTDTGRASTVWVNDTLPGNVAFVSSSVPYASTDGSTYGWMFTNVNPLALNSFTITVRVGVTATDGQVLANAVRLNYADQLGRALESSAAWANATVVRPMITIAKIVDKAIALPGDTLTYTIYYNNTGSAPANHVWINDTLPGGVTYQSASPPPDTIDGGTLRWHFTSVAVGSHSLTVTVTVDASPPAVLVNWAFLNYTAQNDVVLDGGSASAITIIPEFETLVVPIAIPLLLYGLRRRWGKKRKG